MEEAKQTSVFLSIVGAKTYGLLRNLFAPALPRRNQLGNESIAKYVAQLRKMSILRVWRHCTPGQASMWPEERSHSEAFVGGEGPYV